MKAAEGVAPEMIPHNAHELYAPPRGAGRVNHPTSALHLPLTKGSAVG